MREWACVMEVEGWPAAERVGQAAERQGEIRRARPTLPLAARGPRR